MMISKTNSISFTSLKMTQHGSLKVPEDFTCKDINNKQYNVKYKKEHDGVFTIECDNTNNASNKFNVKDGVVYGKYLLVNKNSERLGLGTILHLMKVIELLENNLSVIKLSSLPSAVLFHGKFGFKADIQSFKEAKYMLSSCIPMCFTHEDFISPSTKAASLIASPMTDKNKYINQTNEIFNEVLDICRNKKDIDLSYIRFRDDIFDQSLMYNMKLTREDIIKDKEFYNNLYKKFSIDYQID